MSPRVRLWALVLPLLVLGCATQEKKRFDLESRSYTLCDPAWQLVSEPVPKQSAAALLDQIKAWAIAAGNSSLANLAEVRKDKIFTFTLPGGDPMPYTGRQGWARILVAYRYAEMGGANLAFAEQELNTGGPGIDDPGWAAAITQGPSMSVGVYLGDIATNAASAPWPLNIDILNLVGKLECKRGDIDECYGVPLTDKVAWARLVLAYYLSQNGPIWDDCKKELDHIEN